LASHGLHADLVPDEFMAEALLAALTDTESLQGKRVLLARADIAREALAEGLVREGALVDQVAVYRTIAARPSPELLQRLGEHAIDVVTFTSSSTVRNLTDMLGSNAPLLRHCAVACIGPVTAATARELGLDPAITATTYTIPGLVAAIRHYYEQLEPARGSEVGS
jgi:uroporphyrinogen III methyltransferase/synthase